MYVAAGKITVEVDDQVIGKVIAQGGGMLEHMEDKTGDETASGAQEVAGQRGARVKAGHRLRQTPVHKL